MCNGNAGRLGVAEDAIPGCAGVGARKIHCFSPEPKIYDQAVCNQLLAKREFEILAAGVIENLQLRA